MRSFVNRAKVLCQWTGDALAVDLASALRVGNGMWGYRTSAIVDGVFRAGGHPLLRKRRLPAGDVPRRPALPYQVCSPSDRETGEHQTEAHQ